MSLVDVEAMRPEQRARYEAKRARDFYRYWEPIRALSSTGPAWTDLNDPVAAAKHKPFSCPDKALTAFCQLGALRLGARRAMLFFFDSNYAYVLAEATRSLSLIDDNLHDIEDELWLGHTVIPRGFSVCEHTVNIPAGNKGSNQFDDDSGVVHIVDDLRDDTRFCGQPYVLSGPKARFYAGVPITTPRGHNIGAYCIVDDKVRKGLDQKSVSFLQEMGATIMNHLEMVRLRAEHQRGMQMISGLESFIEGAAAIRQKHRQQSVTPHQQPITAPGPAQMYNGVGAHPKTDPHPDAPFRGDAMLTSTDDVTDSLSQLHITQDFNPQSPPAGGTPESVETVDKQALAEAASVKSQIMTNKVKDLFQRASQLLQHAIAVDGVVILDASVSTHGGLVEGGTRRDSFDDPTTTTDVTGSEDDGRFASEAENDRETDHERDEDVQPEKHCSVLGASYAITKQDSKAPAVSVSEQLLRRLLRRHPRGKIWSFGENGDFSSDDCLQEKSRSGGDSDNISFSSEPAHASRRVKPRSRRLTHAYDARAIKQLFPQARSVALTGLWDQTRERWYAGALVWTSSPIRVFAEEGEMTYISAFCDVMMAEVNRLNALSAVQAKTDFISSISHELRSPLHGILGTVECLQDHLNEPVANGMVAQIETCSRTLLDIIDHLLDYSKINNLSRKGKESSVGANGGGNNKRIALTKGASTHLNSILTLDVEVPLDKVTEEVVETTVYSHSYTRDALSLASRDVAVVLDIDRSQGIDWNCKIALGAWKRLVINLVNNSLKYTESGYILIALKPVTLAGKHKRRGVSLTVTDSGCGMSQDFLENKLFYAFTQENPLAEGTGLGMSLVAKIVKSFGGKVDAQSEQGGGTTITATVPLDGLRDKSVATDATALQLPLIGTKIGFIGSESSASRTSVDKGRAMLLSLMSRGCRELGAEINTPSWTVRSDTVLNLVTERDVPELIRQLHHSKASAAAITFQDIVASKPLIVLCDTALSARALRKSSASQLTKRHIEFVAQPCGPERLARAILACLEGQAREQGLSSSEHAALHTRTQSVRWTLPFASPLREPVPVANVPQSGPPSTSGASRTSSFSTNPDPVTTPTTALRRISQGVTEALSDEQASPAGLEFPFPVVASPLLALPTPAINPDNRASTPLTAQYMPKPKRQLSQQNPNKLSLLLVDDNRINLQLLVTYADKCGHRKLTSTNGLEALKAYKKAAMSEISHTSASSRPRSPLIISNCNADADAHADADANGPSQFTSPGTTASSSPPEKPQVVLMDINMPVMDGFEATRQIRAFEKDNGIKRSIIIALTGLGSASAQHEAHCSGVDVFLTKPVRLRELTKLLQEIAKDEDEQQ